MPFTLNNITNGITNTASISFSSKNQSIFIKFARDAVTHEEIIAKFSLVEIYDILDVLKSHKPFDFAHDGPKGTASGRFSYAEKVVGAVKKTGFIFKVRRDKVEITMVLQNGNVIAIETYLKFVLNRIYNSIYATDKKSMEAAEIVEVTPPPKEEKAEVETTAGDLF